MPQEDKKKKKEFTFQLRYRKKLQLGLSIPLLLLFLVYFINYRLPRFYSRSFDSYWAFESSVYDLIYVMIILVVAAGIVKLVIGLRRHEFDGNLEIRITDKDISVLSRDSGKTTVIGWNNVRFVREMGYTGMLGSKYVLEMDYLGEDGSERTMPLVARQGRYGPRFLKFLNPVNFEYVDKETYEDLFEFFSRKTKIKKAFSFRKGLQRIG